MADLRARGKAVIYITHKIDEVFLIADEVTVMRDGRVVGSLPASRLDRDRLITMMVGRELTQLFPKDNRPTDRIAISVRGLSLEGVFSDVSFDVRCGEILGVAGLVGSRRTEVAETLFGLRRPSSGEITIDGGPVRIDSPATAIERGIAFLTEDRMSSGLFPPLNVHENMEVPVLNGEFVSGGIRQAGETPRGLSCRGCRRAHQEPGPPVRARSAPQWREPAEGPGGPMAVDRAPHIDSRRADARRRRRREG